MRNSIKYLVILRIIVFTFICQAQERAQTGNLKYTFVDGNDTLMVEVIRIDSMKNMFHLGNDSLVENFSDTVDCPVNEYYWVVVDVNNRELKTKSQKVWDYIYNFKHKENFANPVKINGLWLKEIENRENKQLSYEELPTPFNPDRDTSGCAYEFQKIDIDGDGAIENIVELYYLEERLIIDVILDSVQGEWLCKYRLCFGMHIEDPHLTIIDRGYKILAYEFEANTGFAYYNINTRLYRVIDDKIYGIAEYVSNECTYYRFDAIWEDLSSEAVFINDDTLRVDYTFNMFTFKDLNDKMVPDVYILKDKKESVYYKWDNTRREFSQYYETKSQLSRKNEEFVCSVVDFTEMYKSEIENIRRYGTLKQRRALLKKD